MIRIGILGAAKIAPPAIIEPTRRRTDCRVVAVAARDAGRAAAYAAKHDIQHVADSYDALIARDDIDLIYNALPPNRHADLSIAALKAGKAVLCEKPFAMNAGEAAAMQQAAEETGRPLVEAFHYRFHPAFIHALGHVRSGHVGKILSMEADFSVAIPYRPGELRHTLETGGGALMDLGCYCIHMVRTMAGAEPSVASAECHCDRPGVDLSTHARLVFPGDVTASVMTSMSETVTRRMQLHVEGTKGSLTFNNPIHPHRGHKIILQQHGQPDRTETVPGDITYDNQLAHMVDVLAGRAEPLTGGADAVANMRVIDAIYSSAGLQPRGSQPVS
ncbi:MULTISPECIES: Gfo/Idh/MocA family protein [Hyphomonas]|nr:MULTISPECIES: Gfo/Idh/MocA family oxidoreductase [Hyphomonas]MBB39961.1 dehydrogenase [Hyphomonas sp.]|tara:strand:+ start:128 stop:1123 length:996 start_codon:yes stop_codon:yes gene_type:complete